MPELWEHGDESLPYAEEGANRQALHNCNVTEVLVQGLGEGHLPTRRAQRPRVSRHILVEPWSMVAVHADSRGFHHEQSTIVAARESPGTPCHARRSVWANLKNALGAFSFRMTAHLIGEVQNDTGRDTPPHFLPEHGAGRVLRLRRGAARREGADKHGAPPEQRNLKKTKT